MTRPERFSKQFIVSGRVQGVGYRRFVQNKAQQLQISGWTRNLADGRVEVLAQSSQESLEMLEAALRKGPMFSAVKEVAVQDFNSEPINSEFAILPDGEKPA